jgi:hypothetical protein
MLFLWPADVVLLMLAAIFYLFSIALTVLLSLIYTPCVKGFLAYGE